MCLRIRDGMEEYELELENRIKNLMWTVSGDYSLDFKPDLAAFARSRYGALYDGMKQVSGKENVLSCHGRAALVRFPALY